RLDAGETPQFLVTTSSVRDSDWRVAKAPNDLEDRRVEITGPTDRKMLINALNSGARVFMADFEDANSPTWSNLVEGQVNLTDAIERRINFTSPEGKEYKLNEKVATLLVRPRGWHLDERHVEMDEILYELRDHSSGLNAGRWDYIFSVIKKFHDRPQFVLPDRAQVTMTVPFMRAYTELLVKTCHRRGAHAMGGMAAFIPSRRDP